MQPVPLPTPKQESKQKNYELKNRGLNKEEFDSLFDSTIKKYTIHYTGTSKNLDFLFSQLSCSKNSNISLLLKDILIDDSVCLPFDQLGPSTIIYFDTDCNFNTYLHNISDVLFETAKPHLNEEVARRLTEERKIQKEFIIELKKTLQKRGKTINDYSKKQLMDFVFEYVCKNYRYTTELTGPNGEATLESSKYGSTAEMAYKRGGAVCSGRSKLIKLLANNSFLKVPCYLVSGKYKTIYGPLEHMWNEFIDDNGNILEYDSSYHLTCRTENMPNTYEIIEQEPIITSCFKK